MTHVVHGDSGPVVLGSVDDAAAEADAARIASACEGYSRDDDDECYVGGEAANCFDCRARRWMQGGFSCMKGMLRP
jgi:hypothetical protein